MAVKNFPILFLSQGKMVIMLTEYLTLKVFFVDEGIQEDTNKKVLALSNSQVLFESK